MRVLRLFRFFVLCLLAAVLCPGWHAFGQYVEIKTNTDASQKDTLVTTEDIAELFEKNPGYYYAAYLDSLLARKQYKPAERLVQEQLKNAVPQQYPVTLAEMGRVYKAEGKDAKATEQYEHALQLVNGDDVITRSLAKALIANGEFDYACKVFEKASGILMNPYLYAAELANLYARAGKLDKSLEILLSGMPGQNPNSEATKAMLLKLVGNDAEKLRQVQKILIGKINEQPDNVFFVEILTWVYTQKDDWEGALIQIEAVDERNREPGRRLLDFARTAVAAHQYEIADKAYNDVIAKGDDKPFYVTAKSEQLGSAYTRLTSDSAIIPGLADTLAARYEDFLSAYPSFNPYQIISDYAHVEANYLGNPGRAVSIIQKALVRQDIRREQLGTLKLEMGDYYLLLGRIWDASLTYSQVDKEFKQDAMGEDARFRNARLAYYRGDFEWAQRQLLVLKSATSELIANDALALSVLITENVEDSVTYPLRRFACADLLLAQNKIAGGYAILDSIVNVFPKHPLVDDIFMLHAKTEERMHHYPKALEYLERIHKEYGSDVLGDDAVFREAEIYRTELHDNANAKKQYEQLIIEYPGSTFAQAARQLLYDIDHPPAP